MTTFVDEERLLKKVPFFFSNPNNILTEIAQNATRANAKQLDIVLNNDILEVIDDGDGADDVWPLLTLAGSKWDKEVEENQNPAGWGLYFLLCISEEVFIQSRFGSILINSDHFLNSKSYREALKYQINTFDGIEKGFHIKAVLKKEISCQIKADEDNLKYFPLHITINGKTVKKVDMNEEFGDYLIKTTYKGNKVFVDPYKLNLRLPHNSYVNPADHLKKQMLVIWYGIPIETSLYSSPAIVIDIKQGNVLTPVLPYRTTIKADDKLEEFCQFIRAKIVNYCIATINSYKEDSLYHMECLAGVMSRIATTEELSELNKFYITVNEPHYNTDPYGDSELQVLIVNKNDNCLVNEQIRVFKCVGDSKEEVDPANVVLPPGTVKSIELELPDNRYPTWLKEKIVDKTYNIEIHYDPAKKFVNNYEWYKADIRCKNKEIDVLSLATDYGDVTIFYSKTPESFYNISDAVLAKIFNEDGDTWGTQEYEFNEAISSDMKKLTKSYNIYDLFGGFESVGIPPEEIKTIKIEDRKVLITLKKGGEQILKL